VTTSAQAFPELVDHFRFDAVLDGELLVVRNGHVAPFGDLQQRLNRKSVTRAMLTNTPSTSASTTRSKSAARICAACPSPQGARGSRPGMRSYGPPLSDLSELLSFEQQGGAEARWESTREEGIEGLMLKRKDSPYLSGRPKGHWYKWKRQAFTADCVLLYAQKGPASARPSIPTTRSAPGP
jgi:DNA ligase 1